MAAKRKQVQHPGVGQGVGGGNPPALLDLNTAERAAGIGCTIDEIAALLQVHRDTIFTRMHTDPSFGAAIERGRQSGKATLRRMQWQAAQEGNGTMLVWLGKQILGQRDKVEHHVLDEHRERRRSLLASIPFEKRREIAALLASVQQQADDDVAAVVEGVVAEEAEGGK